MSGGSFNYLCHADPAELFNRTSDIERMVEELAKLGFKDAAQETETIKLIAHHFQVLMQARLNRLSPVWKAVEWYRSCDWSLDSVNDAIEKYREPAQPKPQPPLK